MRYLLETKNGQWLQRYVPTTGRELAQAIGEAIAETGPAHDLPPIWETDVVFQADPEEVWQSPRALLLRGYGDCEDIVRYEGARLYGLVAPAVKKVGDGLWHTYLVDAAGTPWDPSGQLQRTGRIMPPGGLAGLGWSPQQTWTRVQNLAAQRLKATRKLLTEATRQLKPFLKDPEKRALLIKTLQAVAPQYAAPLAAANEAITQAQLQARDAQRAAAQPAAFIEQLVKEQSK